MKSLSDGINRHPNRHLTRIDLIVERGVLVEAKATGIEVGLLLTPTDDDREPYRTGSAGIDRCSLPISSV